MGLFIDLLADNPVIAIIISLLANILIAILGVIPSTFVTAGNILYFGFYNGLMISILGEAFGAIIAFYLYRKGIKKYTDSKKIMVKNRFLITLKNTEAFNGFLLVIALRIFPFVPSGIVTFTAAFSKMSILLFSIASTIGKIPALYIEALSIHTVLEWEREYQFTIVAVSLVILYVFFRQSRISKQKKK